MDKTFTISLLPGHLSDEAAYELAEFLKIAARMAFCKYADQIHRHQEQLFSPTWHDDMGYHDDWDEDDGPPF